MCKAIIRRQSIVFIFFMIQKAYAIFFQFLSHFQFLSQFFLFYHCISKRLLLILSLKHLNVHSDYDFFSVFHPNRQCLFAEIKCFYQSMSTSTKAFIDVLSKNKYYLNRNKTFTAFTLKFQTND